MEILAWLAPAAVVTVVAMLWVGWAGRPKREQTERTDADHDRFARAITKAHPAAARSRPVPLRERSTGIAVRPSRRDPQRSTRTSA